MIYFSCKWVDKGERAMSSRHTISSRWKPRPWRRIVLNDLLFLDTEKMLLQSTAVMRYELIFPDVSGIIIKSVSVLAHTYRRAVVIREFSCSKIKFVIVYTNMSGFFRKTGFHNFAILNFKLHISQI